MNKRNLSLTLVLCCSLNITAADKEITLQKIQEVDFNTLIPRVGKCQLNPKDSLFLDPLYESTCSAFQAKRGEFRLTAEPLRLIKIKFNSVSVNSGVVEYLPDGIAKTAVDELKFLPNEELQINSGPLGIVNLEIGGTLVFYQKLNNAEKFELTYDVEYDYVN